MSPSNQRPRPSRQTYRARRVGALVAALVVVAMSYAAVRAVAGAFGRDEGVAGADGATGVDGGAGASPDSSDAPTNSVVASDPSASGTAVDTADTGPPTSANKAKVLILGDSDAGTFGPYLQTLLDGTGIVTTELDYKVSSGLARPDFYDWPAEIEQKLPVSAPDIVVATFGGNDAQGLAERSGDFIVGDPVSNETEWTAEYSERVGAVMDQLLAGGRTLIWVGIPNDDNPDVTARMRVQDQAAKAAAAARPDVIFIDTWKRFSGRDGNWAEFVIDPRDGEGKDVRADDGFHLNQTGAEILAIDIAQAVRDDLRTRGAAI